MVVILIGLAVIITWPVLGAVVFALLFGFLLQTPQRILTRAVRWPSLASSILTFAVVVVLVGPFVLLAWSVHDDLLRFFEMLQDPTAVQENFDAWLAPLGLDTETLAPWVADIGGRVATVASGLVLPTAQFVFDFLVGLLVFFFVLFFAIRDGDRWGQALREKLPLAADDRDRLLAGAGTSIRAITLGTFFVAGVQGVVAGIGWWLFGFPAPLVWGAVILFIGILPFGAPFLVTIPAGIIAMLQGDWFAGIGIIVYTVTVVALTDDVLRPLVIGKTARVHPAGVLVGMIGGAYVLGVAGFLIGPLVFALLGPVMDLWADRRREHSPKQATTNVEG